MLFNKKTLWERKRIFIKFISKIKKRELLKQPSVESVEFWTAQGTEDNTIDSWGDIRAAIHSCKQNGYDYVVRCVTYHCPEGVSEEDFYATDGFDWEVVWENPTRG